MKKSSAVLSLTLDARRSNLPQTIGIVIALSVVLGMLLTDSTDEMIAYLMVTMACAVPILFWIYIGAGGIPVMASVSSMCFIYYALPILRKNASLSEFGSSEFLSAAVTVALFLCTATLAWGLLLALGARRSRSAAPEVISGPQLEGIMFLGFALGVVYHIAASTGLLNWLGPGIGLARSAMLTTATAACFMLGHARAQGSLRGQKWVVAVGAMGILVLLSLVSLFLVIGMVYCLAAVFGYVITCRRLPWVFLSAALALLMVLHAGKDVTREKYWFAGKNYGGEVSLMQAPALLADWMGNGVITLSSGESYSSIVDRASLLGLLMTVQRMTPDYIPPLEGESYMVLPKMLVPRFVDPDKITSQAAMNMLNVRFGFLSEEETTKTAVGWGLIAEAYANFGRLGVIGVALVLGLFCATLERWSASAAVVSLPSLVAVVVMMQIVNAEYDAAGLVTASVQSTVAIAIVFWSLKVISEQKRPRRNPVV